MALYVLLYVLSFLSDIITDPDTSLFPYLIQGVPTGFSEKIQASQCFPAHDHDIEHSDTTLSVHFANWGTAEDRPDIVAELVADEVAKGWVVPFRG